MISVNEMIKYVDNSYVILDLQADNKYEAISEMLINAESNGLRINIAQTMESIFKKERIMTSGLGYGIAFPHLRTNEVSDNNLIFAISRKGLDYSSLDQKPVHILAMCLTNKDSNDRYLNLISLFTKMSKLIMYPVLLLESKSAEEFKDKLKYICEDVIMSINS